MGKSNATKDRESNEKIQAKNRESTENINTQNLDFQRENLEYQKALQQQIFEREDSSYQRTVQDMRKAGLSPLTMQGTNGGGELIATTAMNAGQPYQEQGLFNRVHAQEANLNMLNSVLSGMSDLMKTSAEIKNINAQTEGVKLNNYFNEHTQFNRINEANLNEVLTRYKMLDEHQKYKYNNYYGIHSGMNDEEKMARIIITELGLQNEPDKAHYNEDAYFMNSFNGSFSHFPKLDSAKYGGEYQNLINKIKKYMSDNNQKKDNMSRDDHMKELGNILNMYGSFLGF